MASLYLNLGDSYAALGHLEEAAATAERAAGSVLVLPVGGYRDFVEMGIRRLQQRIGTARVAP